MKPEDLRSLLGLLASGMNAQWKYPLVRVAVRPPLRVAVRPDMGDPRVAGFDNIEEWSAQQLAETVIAELDRLQGEISTRDARIKDNHSEISELKDRLAKVDGHLHNMTMNAEHR